MTSPPAELKARHYYILLALSRDAQHGLAIAREVQQLSAGAVRLWPATLYGTLDDLADRGWIEELAEHPADQSEKKRFYTLTSAGRRILTTETERLATLVKLARARIRAGEVS